MLISTPIPNPRACECVMCIIECQNNILKLVQDTLFVDVDNKCKVNVNKRNTSFTNYWSFFLGLSLSLRPTP